MSAASSVTDVPLPKRVHLAQLPTPVEKLNRLTTLLGGPKLWIKRDDQTGLGLGGNKTRKLEFLVAEALQQGCDVLLTAGAAQSNHCRQTAAAAAKVGLRCELVLGGKHGDVPEGNLLLDALFGATVHWTGMERRGERMEERAAELRREGRRPYVIPYGGSNGVGATGYVVAMAELVGQLNASQTSVDRIIVASSSGGTQAGLVLGKKIARFPGEIIGISIDKGERGTSPYEKEMSDIANATADWLGLDTRCTPEDFCVRYEFLGGGYGVVGALEREAVALTAAHEGILLDPVYTGRAMGGLLAMVRAGEFRPDEQILFWHTGGAPALFAYGAELLSGK
jgi:D-cysteine desulfhydrase family pyridoxal phosphate-dependent enzyme